MVAEPILVAKGREEFVFSNYQTVIRSMIRTSDQDFLYPIFLQHEIPDLTFLAKSTVVILKQTTSSRSQLSQALERLRSCLIECPLCHSHKTEIRLDEKRSGQFVKMTCLSCFGDSPVQHGSSHRMVKELRKHRVREDFYDIGQDAYYLAQQTLQDAQWVMVEWS